MDQQRAEPTAGSGGEEGGTGLIGRPGFGRSGMTASAPFAATGPAGDSIRRAPGGVAAYRLGRQGREGGGAKAADLRLV